jgi:DNA-binding transcriptional regulator YdaS (Cro superfamily)
MKIHPAAEIFPMLSDEELDSLAVDIKTHGLRHPLVMHERELLDGRNRLAACKIAGVAPSFVEYEGDSPVSFVISVNIKRRQLDASQRACVAVEIEPMFAVEAEKRLHLSKGRGVKGVANLRQVNQAKASDQAADVVSVSPRMVQYAKEIKAKNPEAFERVKSGEVTVNEVQQEIKREKRADASAKKHAEETAPSVQLDGVRVDVKRGQVWILGDHRLMCGDARDPHDMQLLTNSIAPDAIITDPPYGIDYLPDWKRCDGSDGEWKKIVNDDTAFDPSFLLDIATETTVIFGANHFSDQLPCGSWICWDKRLTEDADLMYGSPFELAWFKSTRTSKTSIMVRCLHGGVINADRQSSGQAHRFHPTQKPIIVMREIIEKLTLNSDRIFDPFIGSGTTLLACQELGRKCWGMEIDPEYVATAMQRWTRATGLNPIKERNAASARH